MLWSVSAWINAECGAVHKDFGHEAKADPLAGFFIQDIPTNVKIRLIFG